jgi:hypothetical protein
MYQVDLLPTSLLPCRFRGGFVQDQRFWSAWELQSELRSIHSFQRCSLGEICRCHGGGVSPRGGGGSRSSCHGDARQFLYDYFEQNGWRTVKCFQQSSTKIVFLCTCHHTMRVDVVEQKVLVYLSSGDEGGPSQTKNSCGSVITWRCTF